MSDNKNYNLLALKGNNVDDMEFVEMYNLDPAVAYTPQINDVMIDTVYQLNLNDPNPNLPVDEARKKAIVTRDKMRHEVKRLYASLGMYRDVSKKN